MLSSIHLEGALLRAPLPRYSIVSLRIDDVY